jgi:serine/threonine protein kinase
MSDFQILRTIGRGYYGKVVLCRRISTNKLWAIKTVHKDLFVEVDKATPFSANGIS